MTTLRVLLVADRVPRAGLRAADWRLFQLLAELRALWPSATLTLAAVDGIGAPRHAGALRRLGVLTLVAPRDWSAWSRESRGQFDLVVVHGAAARARLGALLAESQPQAVVALDWCAGSPRAGAVAAPGWDDGPASADPAIAPWEGLHNDLYLAVSERDRSEALAGAGARAAVPLPGHAPAPAPFSTEPRPRAVIIGSFLDGPGAPDERALRFVVEDVMPRVRARVPDAVLSIVGEDLTPAVRGLAGEGVEIAPPLADVSRWLERAAVVLAPRRDDATSPLPILAAAAAGVPLVASAEVAAQHDLDQLDAAADPWTFAERVRELMTSRSRWHAARAELLEWAAERRSRGRYRAALVDALADLGIAPSDPRQLEPTPPAGPGRWSTDGPGTRAFVAPPGAPPPQPVFPDVLQTGGLPGPEAPETRGPFSRYHDWRLARPLTEGARRRAEQEIAGFHRRPRISIVTPVYNTEPWVLSAALDSVLDQVYPHWELCLADDASTWPESLATVRRYAAFDARIKLIHRPVNGGIVAASNDALALATGEYVAFLDHDDELDPMALFEVARMFDRHPELDMVYSDEEKVSEQGELISPAIKPAWSPDLLMSGNYVCHLSVYRRELLQRLGGLRDGFDGAQDMDLVLRVAEETDRVAHIAKPLYRWRMVPGSVAVGAAAKPYAFPAGRKALEDAMRRRGHRGSVEELWLRGLYRVRYAIEGSPRVALVVHGARTTGAASDAVERALAAARAASLDAAVAVLDDDGRLERSAVRLPGGRSRLVRVPADWPASRILNALIPTLAADMVALVDARIEPRDDEWLQALVEHAQRPEIGMAGAHVLDEEDELVSPRLDDERFDEGVVEEWRVLSAVARSHAHVIRNVSAVTPACCVTRPTVLRDVGGFDERFADPVLAAVDLCLRLRLRGYRIVMSPHARVGLPGPLVAEAHLVRADRRLLDARWRTDGPWPDPYYNPNYPSPEALLHRPPTAAWT